MAASKHYLSDVIVGAGIGIAAGRTVTFHLAGEKFALGAAPTQGGAMVTFTRVVNATLSTTEDTKDTEEIHESLRVLRVLRGGEVIFRRALVPLMAPYLL